MGTGPDQDEEVVVGMRLGGGAVTRTARTDCPGQIVRRRRGQQIIIATQFDEPPSQWLRTGVPEQQQARIPAQPSQSSATWGVAAAGWRPT